ncbi:aldose 1-epimerase family protein [Cellulomonas xylanilytica]|uniref:Aldose 1-epimerase n=1 Tax=Cellulomonas xylanilytica TaxID=233583 RepID=A0A510V2X6_9CELL|nr:aldose 1-epimerase family protein [Cellulomonas xylanilytica]GEK20211.1 aldose 1-epimerase [Cellulomonas xylanilytica]
MRGTPPSGRQYRIMAAGHEAVVTQVGAGLRECTFDGRPVLDGYDEAERAPDGRGQVLAPFPNRIADGRYTFGGRTCQVAMDEPERGNAIHGMVRWLDWTEVSFTEHDVVLACVLRPQPGFAWELTLQVGYHLDRHGLTVASSATNTGTEPAPFGMGFHPYLGLGAPVDGLELLVPARTHSPVPADRDRRPEPVGVTGTDLDFRSARAVGPTVLDTVFGDLVRGADGRAVVRLTDPVSADGVQLWVDESFPYVMVYSADGVLPVERQRRSLAVEPMTCPPHAFRSGADVVTLAPGESWSGTWGLAAG